MGEVIRKRSEYIAGICGHREYHAQFVTPSTKAWVRRTFKLELLLEADQHLNTPKIKFNVGGTWWVWDGAPVDADKLRAADNAYARADITCIAKEAATQVLEEEGYFWDGERWAKTS